MGERGQGGWGGVLWQSWNLFEEEDRVLFLPAEKGSWGNFIISMRDPAMFHLHYNKV